MLRTTEIQRLEADLEAAQVHAGTLHERFKGRQLNDYEQGMIHDATSKVHNLRKRLHEAKGNNAMLGQIDEMLGTATSRFTASGSRGGLSLGAQFVGSEQYQRFRELGQNRGVRWSTGVVELHSELLDSDAGSPGSGGDLVVPDYRPGIVALPQRRLTMAQLFAPGTTESNAIIYMKETAFENNADTVAEGALKPESGLRFDAQTDRVYKIAHWLPVTDEMLEDVPALRSYIDARLRLGVQLAEDYKLLLGAASPEELTGILNRDGLADPIVSGGSPQDSNADAIARQIGAIETAQQLPVDGIVMNPTDFMNILLSKTESGEYHGDGPFALPQRPVLWGRPVALTPAMTLGSALVGAFRAGGQVFRKGGLRVEMSNSHEDYFIRNLTAIRAEERLALAVYRPAAFGLVTGL